MLLPDIQPTLKPVLSKFYLQAGATYEPPEIIENYRNISSVLLEVKLMHMDHRSR